MKLQKSIITAAVLVALSASHSASATEKETKKTANPIQTQLMANAAGNVIILSQTSDTGAVFGNDVTLLQEGDLTELVQQLMVKTIQQK